MHNSKNICNIVAMNKKRPRITEAHIEQFRCYLYNERTTAYELAQRPEFAKCKSAVASFASKKGAAISPACREVMNLTGIIDIEGAFVMKYNPKSDTRTVISK